MIRDDIKAALTSAMKSGDKAAVGTMRMLQAAIKNRDIEIRGALAQAGGRSTEYDRDHTTVPARPAKAPADDDALVTEVLQKMIKQRRESAEMYTAGNRPELAATETAEIATLEAFLPRQMDEAEARAAIGAIIAETGASSMKDMGRVMADVKQRHATSIEPAKASALVKAMLSGA